MALGSRGPARALLHHSNRGVQYASGEYQALLPRHGMICSMSKRGDWQHAYKHGHIGDGRSPPCSRGNGRQLAARLQCANTAGPAPQDIQQSMANHQKILSG